MADSIKNYFILHYHFDQVAGTERVLYNIIEHLVQDKNNKVHLILLKPKHDLIFDVQKLPITVHFLEIDSYAKSSKIDLLKTVFQVSKSLTQYIKSCSIGEKNSLITTNVYLAYAAYLASKKIPKFSLEVISCEHFTVTATSKVTNWFRYLFYSKINVVMLTESDAEYIRKKYKPKNCVCIPNAIPFELQKYQGQESKKIIAIGRYTYQKGFDLLIKAFAQIGNKYPDWSLQIIGDDYGDKQLMQDLILQNNLKNVFLLPATQNIRAYYKEASFFVMSSRFEGLPMVLLEALGFGLPIVSFNCPTGPAQVVSNDNGFLVENGNLDQLAQSIEALIINDELRKIKAKGAERKAKDFTKERINDMWDGLFEKI